MQEREDSMGLHRSKLTASVSAAVIIALLVVSAILLLTVGLQVYRNVVVASEENFELRTSLSYVATKIRQTDAAGSVYVTNKDGMDVLVLEEDYYGEALTTYVYYMDGCLREYPADPEEDFEPEFGLETIEVDGFDINSSDGIITLTARDNAGVSESLSLVLRSK